MEQSRNGGAVVVVSSIAGRSAGPTATQGISSYGISKYSVSGMTQILALESIPSKIRVNAVCPTGIVTDLLRKNNRKRFCLSLELRFRFTETDTTVSIGLILFLANFVNCRSQMSNFNPMLANSEIEFPQPKDVSGVVSFLVGPESRFVNGILLPIDGGYGCK